MDRPDITLMRTAAFILIGALAMNLAAATGADRDPVIRGNTAFTVDLYRRQADGQGGNIFFSPYSISAAMAMVDLGARGATAAEIEKALHIPFGDERLAQAWTAVLHDVNDHGSGYDLITANALWVAHEIELRAGYLTLARDRFGARMERLDFAHAHEAARGHINAWVSDATRKKINDLLGPGTIDAGTLLVLTNAIYMKAKWSSPFEPGSTTENGTFHAAAGDTRVPMMHQTNQFRLYHGDGIRMLDLPYRGGELAMLIILPDANDGLPQVEKALTPEKLAAWEAGLAANRVAVSLPRFSTEMSLDLGDTLRAMGIHLAFDTTGAADFSGMSTSQKLAISRVIHKARVDVTEEGTEAAAATAVTMRAGAMVAQTPPEIFQADHPFLYLIRRNGSGSVLFVGRLVKPGDQ
jgi:serpin B